MCDMILVGCDFQSRYQQIAWVDTETGDLIERRLEHESGGARAFCSSLPAAALVGVEATGTLQWFAGCGRKNSMGVPRSAESVA
jgi:hypothetical protein